MKKHTLFLFTIFTGIFISCQNQKSENDFKEKNIDYSNKKTLDSLIKITSTSKDTLFLGFTIGMTKSNYKNHIQKLRNEGKTISYSNSNIISNIAGKFELGSGYTFKTSISSEEKDKTLTGNGQYFLEPIYNKEGLLMQFNILSIENWDGDYGINKPNWFKTKIEDKYPELSNENLKKALIENEIIDEYDSVWQKGNLIIYETSLSTNYIDLKSLLIELLIKETTKDVIKKENENVKI